MPGHVFVVPDTLIAAAAELDAVAARLESAVALNGPALRVAPSGSEEVSQLAASYFNRLADTFEPAAAEGIAELREAARTLRQQAATYQTEDQTIGAALAAGM